MSTPTTPEQSGAASGPANGSPSSTENSEPGKPESLFRTLLPLITIGALLGLLIGGKFIADSFKPKPWTLIQDTVTGNYGYLNRSRTPQYVGTDCQIAKSLMDKDKAWFDEFDRKRKAFKRQPKPKDNPYRIIDPEKECQ